MKIKLLTLLLAAGSLLAGQNFQSGKHAIAYDINAKAMSMKIMAETAYDPVKDEGDSVYTIYWNKSTRFFIQKAEPFATMKPGTPGWFFLTPKDAANLKAGKTFATRRIDVEAKLDGKFGLRSAQKAYAPFFPKGKGRGEVELDGKRIKFKAPDFVNVFSVGKSDDIRAGENKLRIFGKVTDGKFVASRIQIIVVPPRKDIDPALPNVLVAGDSISMNYEQALKKALAGKMNCQRIEGNSGDSNRGNSALKLWLMDVPGVKSRWSVVVLNHGLHDLKQKADPKTKVFDPKHQVEPDVYAKNIDRLLKYLTTNGYKVVWCTTTPVPDSSYGQYARRKDEDLVYNKVLEPVLKKYPQVTVCDLNAVVRNSKVFDEWRKGNNVHFRTDEEKKLLGDAVAAAILKAAAKK